MSNETQVSTVALTGLKFVNPTQPIRSRIYEVEGKIVDSQIDLLYWEGKAAEDSDPEILKSLQRTKQAIKDLNAMYSILIAKFEELGGKYKEDEEAAESTADIAS